MPITRLSFDHLQKNRLCQQPTKRKGLAFSYKFNSDAMVHRTTKQLQQKFNNLKKIARKEMSAERSGRRQTGGGPPPVAPSDTTEWLNTIMGESISGLPAVFDSDMSDITIDEHNTTGATEIVIMDTITDLKPYKENATQIQNSSEDQNVLKHKLKDRGMNDISETEDKHENDVFDASTPQAMLRKPVSKQLLTPNNRRKKLFTPLETRKKIINHIDTKMDILSHKKERDDYLMKLAHEEHLQTVAQQKDMHEKQIAMMEEKHVKFLELHNIEVEFKKQMNALLLEKVTLEIENNKNNKLNTEVYELVFYF